MKTLKITGSPPTDVVITVDGEPVELEALDLHIDAESFPVITVKAPVHTVDIEGVVELDERSARTIAALGWTPPGDGKPEMSDAEFAVRMQKWARRDPAGFRALMQRQARITGEGKSIGRKNTSTEEVNP